MEYVNDEVLITVTHGKVPYDLGTIELDRNLFDETERTVADLIDRLNLNVNS